MSSASLVPETRHLKDDDAWQALHQTGEWLLLRDALQRLRVADGFSHARALAYLIALVSIQGLIGLVGLAGLLHKGSVSHVAVATIRKFVGGSAGHLLTAASKHAHHDHRTTAILVILVTSVVTATTAMGQIERTLNRIYGIEQDRPIIKKYSRALLLALTSGTLSALAFVCLAVGRDLLLGTGLSALSTAWSLARWPLGFIFILWAITLIFRWLPRRSQPQMSWLVFGSAVGTVLWGVVTIGFGLFLEHSSSFSDTYGPLAGVVALLLWSFLSSVVVFYGAAVTAQLEAVRAGAPTPRDEEKVTNAWPSVDGISGGAPTD